VLDTTRYTVDTPVPYRVSDLTSLIDERMGKLENKRDIAPYRNLKTRFEILSLDPRYSFMFGSLTVYDGMAQILSRIFRVPVNEKPITILELTGLPTEIVNVVVSVLCRMTFDFALWSEGKVPVTLVCEEAHRYVPANPALGFEPCKRAIAKIAKEGRKYGASLCIVTQRPAEIDPTILSQCNTVFALRMSNDRDQEIVQSAISDTGSGLLEFLSALGQREAIAFGDGVTLPVRIRFDLLPQHCMPRSSTARFSEMWKKSVNDDGFLDQVVEKWRLSNSGPQADIAQQTTMLAEAFGIGDASEDALALHNSAADPSRARMPADGYGSAQRPYGDTTGRREVAPPRRDPAAAQAAAMGGAGRTARDAASSPPVAPSPPVPPTQAPGALRSLRERLTQRK
jgi:DNA helicase HerA-like ATPase